MLDKDGNAAEHGIRGLLTYNGGTVCDDGFSYTEANAICIEMGFAKSTGWTSGNDFESLQGSLDIKLVDVTCEDENWGSCSYLPNSEYHDCDHSEDVFISCTCSGINSFDDVTFL